MLCARVVNSVNNGRTHAVYYIVSPQSHLPRDATIGKDQAGTFGAAGRIEIVEL